MYYNGFPSPTVSQLMLSITCSGKKRVFKIIDCFCFPVPQEKVCYNHRARNFHQIPINQNRGNVLGQSKIINKIPRTIRGLSILEDDIALNVGEKSPASSRVAVYEWDLIGHLRSITFTDVNILSSSLYYM